jgi:hypothetical protein
MISPALPVSGQPGGNAVCSAAIRAETDRFLHPVCVRAATGAVLAPGSLGPDTGWPATAGHST